MMQRKLILVLIDGLNYQTAVSKMGFMQHLTEQRLAYCYAVKTELPTLSRALYETILTGTPPCQHGVMNNQIVRRSREESLFELAVRKGLRTAAAAYFWISELYNRAPFDPVNDREQSDPNANIQQGKFYFDDGYPDSHLLLDGEILRRKSDPDFLLIHPMGVDDTGHRYGGQSKEYCRKALEIDVMLGTLLPGWLEAGYQIIVTADHGMDPMGSHGGNEEWERKVPLWVLGDCFGGADFEGEIPQLALAPLVCNILNIEPGKKMIRYDFPGLKIA